MLVGSLSATPGSVPQGHVCPSQLLCLSESVLTCLCLCVSYIMLSIFLPTLWPLQGEGLLSQDTNRLSHSRSPGPEGQPRGAGRAKRQRHPRDSPGLASETQGWGNGLSTGQRSLVGGRLGGIHTRRTEPGWLPQEASTFIDACSGPADFLVSLLLREGGPAKAVQAVGSA